MLQKNDITDVIMEPTVSQSTFKLQSMTEEATLRFEKQLGENGRNALILGYVVVPGVITTPISPTLDKVRLYANKTFGDGCKVFPINPHDTLPEHLRSKMSYFRNETNMNYCLIYLPPENGNSPTSDDVGKTSPL